MIYLAERDIIRGKSEFYFSPNDFLTREEVAAIFKRTVEYLEFDLSSANGFLYHDDFEISDWAKEAVYQMRNSKIMIGTNDYNFSPKGTFTKEQAIAATMRVFDNYIATRSEN